MYVWGLLVQYWWRGLDDHCKIGNILFCLHARGRRPRVHLWISLRHLDLIQPSGLHYFKASKRKIFSFLFFEVPFLCIGLAIAPARTTPSSTTLVKSGIAFRTFRALRCSSSACFLMIIFARAFSFSDGNVHVSSRMWRGRSSAATYARFLSWTSLEIHGTRRKLIDLQKRKYGVKC